MKKLCTMAAAVVLAGCESERERTAAAEREAEIREAGERAGLIVDAKIDIQLAAIDLIYGIQSASLTRSQLERERVAGRAMLLRDELREQEAGIETAEATLTETFAALRRKRIAPEVVDDLEWEVNAIRTCAQTLRLLTNEDRAAGREDLSARLERLGDELARLDD